MAVPKRRTEAEAAKTIQPIVIELGKVGQSKIRELKAGRGELFREVTEAVAVVRHNLADEAEGKLLLPVVVLYRKKARKRDFKLPFLSW